MLEPNEDADTVRMMFDWYVKDGMTPGAIARKMNSMGYKATRGGDWSRDTVRDMLRNVHYIGKIKYNETKATWVMENGERVLKHLPAPSDEVIISEGKHDGIIDPELFDEAQKRMASNPRIKKDFDLVNVFAGIIRCSKCKKVLVLDQKRGHSSARKNYRETPRYLCRHRPQCFKSAKAPDIEQGILYALEQVELPKLQAKLKNGDGDAAVIQKRRIDKLIKQMAEYREQEDNQYDLLERKKYTQEVFDRRNAALREKMDACEKELHLARAALPQNVDYGEAIISLEEAIAGLKNAEMSNNEKNRLLKAIIDKIEYSSVDTGFNKVEIKLEVFLKL